MSKIKEFENIPDIDIEGEETLEEAVADCKALFGKYNKELFNGEVSLERCSEARLFDSHCLRRERVQPESRKEHR